HTRGSGTFVEKQGGQEKRLLGAFYPDSLTPDGAVPIDVQPGRDFPEVDFQLRIGPVFHIRGKLAGNFRQPLNVRAILRGLGRGVLAFDGEGREEGTFDFYGLPAGDYDVELYSYDLGQTIAEFPVALDKSDVNGLVLPIPNRFELKGVVHRLDTASAAVSQV